MNSYGIMPAPPPVHTDHHWLQRGLATGLTAIGIWFAATRTTLFLAYRGGSLSQVQGLCDSDLGRLGRGMSAQAAAECARIDSYSMWLNLLGFAGLVLLVISAGVIAYQALQRL